MTTTFAPAALSMRTRLNVSYEEAMALVPAALKQQGFGVLTEIDVKATLKQKIGADFRKYTILGACNPALSHRALSTELELGLLLPCNVLVYEEPEQGSVIVSIVEPLAMLGIMDVPALLPVAQEAHDRLSNVLNALGGEIQA